MGACISRSATDVAVPTATARSVADLADPSVLASLGHERSQHATKLLLLAGALRTASTCSTTALDRAVVVRSKSSGLKLSPSQALPLGLPGGEQSSLAHIVTSRADSLALHCADTSRATGSVTGIRPIIFPSPPSGFYLHAAGSGPDESTASQAASSIPADQPSLVSINWDALQQEMLHALAIEDLAQRKDSIPSYVLQAAYNSDMLRATTAPSQMQRQQSGTPGAGIVVLPAGSPAVGTNSNVVPRGTDTQRRVTDEERSSLTSNMTSRPSFELTTFTDPDPPRHTYPPVKPSESHSADFAAYAHLTGIKALSSRTSNLQQPAARPAGPPVNLPGVEGKPARVSQGAPVMPAQPALSKRRAATVHDLAEPRGMAHASAHGLGASGMVVATPPGSPPVIAVRQTLIGRGCSSMSGPDEIPGAKQLSVVPLLQAKLREQQEQMSRVLMQSAAATKPPTGTAANAPADSISLPPSHMPSSSPIRMLHSVKLQAGALGPGASSYQVAASPPRAVPAHKSQPHLTVMQPDSAAAAAAAAHSQQLAPRVPSVRLREVGDITAGQSFTMRRISGSRLTAGGVTKQHTGPLPPLPPAAAPPHADVAYTVGHGEWPASAVAALSQMSSQFAEQMIEQQRHFQRTLIEQQARYEAMLGYERQRVLGSTHSMGQDQSPTRGGGYGPHNPSLREHFAD